MTTVISDPSVENFQELSIADEMYRIYTYEDGSTFTIQNVVTLAIRKTSEGGVTHRVIDNNGVCHYPRSDWVGISWHNREGAPRYNF